MRALLNDDNINQLEPREKPYEVADTKIAGFAVRVRPTGRITYLLSYKNKSGKSQTYTIGKHGSNEDEYLSLIHI